MPQTAIPTPRSARASVHAVALVLAVALAGCVAPPAGSPIEEARAPSPTPGDAAAAAPAGTVSSLAGGAKGSFVLDEALTVEWTRIRVAPADAPPEGVPGVPVELAVGAAKAWTALQRDHWVLAARIVEARPLAEGAFRVLLDWNGEPRGEVHVAQGTPEDATEGVVVSFDVGAELPVSSVYLLAIERVGGAPKPVEVTLDTNPAKDLTWIGTGESAGIVNPPLSVRVGAALLLTARNADGLYHNVGVLDATGKTVAGPSADVAGEGESAALTWSPTVPGDYAYVCFYHAKTMRGTIEVR